MSTLFPRNVKCYFEPMAEIYVSIWNQDEVAMSSVDGELIVVLVTKDGRFQAQQAVTIRQATAFFYNLQAGDYTIIARHSSLMPTEARYDVGLGVEAAFGIRFVYNEAQRRLLRIDTQMRFFS